MIIGSAHPYIESTLIGPVHIYVENTYTVYSLSLVTIGSENRVSHMIENGVRVSTLSMAPLVATINYISHIMYRLSLNFTWSLSVSAQGNIERSISLQVKIPSSGMQF